MKCPSDGSEMEARTIEAIDPVVLDVCPKCDGIWMDRGELKRVSQDELIEHKTDVQGRSSRLCPRCREWMSLSQLNSVTIDECNCGIYFDKGEVDRVLAKKLAYKTKDGCLSIGVTVLQMKEMLAKGSVKIDSVELRLIRETDEQA